MNSFEEVRGQIGKGGDKLIPHFLSEDAQRDHGKELEAWRGKRFKSKYLPLVRPFSAVPELLRREKDAGVRIAVTSSTKKDGLKKVPRHRAQTQDSLLYSCERPFRLYVNAGP